MRCPSQIVVPNAEPNCRPGRCEGLCPKCLLAAGLESRDDAGKSAGSGSEAPTTPHSGSFVPPEPAALAAHFPQLEILELLGHGGMGAVYKARQPRLDRLVALKIIRPESADTPAFAERFNREAKTLARLSHPHIVAVYDFGEVSVSDAAAGGQPRPLYFFIMEYVDGPNLRQLMRTGRIDAAAGAGDRAADLRSAAVRPRRGRRPPRHQAGKHPARQARPREDRRLRPGEAGGPLARTSSHSPARTR